MNIKWEAKEYAENFGFVPQYGKNVFKLPMWIKILIFAPHLHIILRKPYELDYSDCCRSL